MPWCSAGSNESSLDSPAARFHLNGCGINKPKRNTACSKRSHQGWRSRAALRNGRIRFEIVQVDPSYGFVRHLGVGQTSTDKCATLG